MRRHRHGNGPKTGSNAIGCMAGSAESLFALHDRGVPFRQLKGERPSLPRPGDPIRERIQAFS
ncbi:hypothetical protein MPLB_600003 [Mesorhizobium sp. ORS 3324]|nr:hypothetical protein MPLB_600003 [Mesorhizobium sp. ORS 3324]